uniref:Uncharacterized protein n=1 Tax=Mola mola TaxID=94237 RepID=A0A3Q3VJE9_MOLML
MDIPGCPSQNPQSPEEEEEKSLSERELLNSPDEEDRFNSDSEIDGEDGEEGYSVYGSKTSKKTDGAQVDEEEEEDGRMRAVERRRATALNELKDDSVSVSRELDEHELDYDEEVPEVPRYDKYIGKIKLHWPEALFSDFLSVLVLVNVIS